jgi:hypothetical protein
MGNEPTTYRTNELAKRIEAGLGVFRRALSDDEIKVLGEVIEIRNVSKSANVVTLIDHIDGATSFSAHLPAGLRPPKLGSVAEVVGRLGAGGDGSAAEVFLDGSSFYEAHEECSNHQARTELLKKLRRETKTTKLGKPTLPFRKLAIVAGRDTKAEDDFRCWLWPDVAQNLQTVPVHLRDAADIARGIKAAADERSVDGIVVVRGGGTPFELHRFSQPEVLEAIAAAACKKYVLVAIGHARDRPLANQVASRYEATPTSAAAYLNSLLREQKRSVYDYGAPGPFLSHPPRTSGWQRWPRLGIVKRIERWLGGWIRRAIIFTIGTAFGILVAPQVSRKPNPAVVQGTPSTGSAPVNGRYFEGRTGKSKRSKGESDKAENSIDEGTKPSR